MAKTPEATLYFADNCNDCGYREINLPEPLPAVGDDFDWLIRDYDGFRLFMLEELAARFAERQRWTPADMEVVIVEALAVVMDQLSDMLDRVHHEAFLESARRPSSVRRLLSMIGYDAIKMAETKVGIPTLEFSGTENVEETFARLKGFQPTLQNQTLAYEELHKESSLSSEELIDQYLQEISDLTPSRREVVAQFIQQADAILDTTDPIGSQNRLDVIQAFMELQPELVELAQVNSLEKYWLLHPEKMDAARTAGPIAIHTQKRAVTETDYANRLREHPLVLNAHAWSRWTGSWMTLYVAVILTENIPLDVSLSSVTTGDEESFNYMKRSIDQFHLGHDLDLPAWSEGITARTVLRPYLDAYRMAGQEVFLQDTELVGIIISISIRISPHYYQSEIQRNVSDILGTGLGGFFAAGNFEFGEDLHASDIIEVVMALDGVEAVCLNRFKRVGQRYADQSDKGRIELSGLEVAVCENDPAKPQYGYLKITCHGGRRG